MGWGVEGDYQFIVRVLLALSVTVLHRALSWLVVFHVVLYFAKNIILSHPVITAMVDWALKTNHPSHHNSVTKVLFERGLTPKP